jgi:tRNA pseudouridine38/39 synthase
MSKFRQRQIVLKFLYFGGEYDGLAAQENTEETIERYLFESLIKTRLVVDRASCRFSRCGRTDKGVSALCQVVCLRLRSNFPVDVEDAKVEAVGPGDSIEVVKDNKGQGKKNPHGKSAKMVMEVDYCAILNRSLPDDIRIISWAPAPPPTEGFESFSARFNADTRTYRYFFVRRNLDLQAMRAGADLLIGTHDFRNFCKMDAVNVSNFVRKIYYFRVVEADNQPDVAASRQICYFEVCGQAFLWHQVRCMTAILFLVGRGLEQPEILGRMTDLAATPRKPQYKLASEQPLVLHNCFFHEVTYCYQPHVLARMTNMLEKMWELHTIRAAQVQNALSTLAEVSVRRSDVVKLENYSTELYETAAGAGAAGAGAGAAGAGAAGAGAIGAGAGAVMRWRELIQAMPMVLVPKRKKAYQPLVGRVTAYSYEDRLTSMSDSKRKKMSEKNEKGGGWSDAVHPSDLRQQ